MFSLGWRLVPKKTKELKKNVSVAKKNNSILNVAQNDEI